MECHAIQESPWALGVELLVNSFLINTDASRCFALDGSFDIQQSLRIVVILFGGKAVCC